MNKKIFGVLTIMIASVVIIACNPNSSNNTSENIDSTSTQTNEIDSAECAQTSPELFPNQDKPMALMMRQMADEAQAMREKIIAGKRITAEQFPFIRFHLVEPTDPEVLQPQFFENARLFQLSYKDLMAAEAPQQKDLYNLYINNCVKCHEQYCSGPLKRIKKLPITE
jgi:hypothetical protein